MKRTRSKGLGAAKDDGVAGALLSRSVPGSAFVILSGVILYSEKTLMGMGASNWFPKQMLSYYGSADVLIWTLAQTFSPILLATGALIGAKPFSYLVVFYCYFLQLYFVMVDIGISDAGYTHYYTFGTTAILFGILVFYKRYQKRKAKSELAKARKGIFDLIGKKGNGTGI